MLRDNSEKFAPDFKIILEEFGISSDADHGFQLLKFERVSPDVFVWLLRDYRTFLVTISDRPEDHVTNKEWFSKWLGGYDAKNVVALQNINGETLVSDGFDTIQVFELPDDYDHDEWVSA